MWPALHAALLAELRAADALDLEAAAVDSSHVRALNGGIPPAPARSTGAGPAPSTT